MRTTTMRKKTLAVAAVASLTLFTAACGSDDEADTSADDAPTSDAPEAAEDDTDDVAANLVGPGCADYAAAVPDGGGSVQGMAQDPVATAASNNPLLTTLVAAVSGGVNPAVDLVDTLNGGEFTVFAPVDDAFAALEASSPGITDTLATEEGGGTLSSVLTYHVIPGQILPDDLAGTTQTTVNGADVEITGSGDSLQVNGANVICGGVKTANATVYLIDAVLMPPA
ncbi:fasciclin domain-containing protein [Aeromicrobium marinum]|nr:fasciclin domain-containing protein [Aeromicrobium marinum]